MAKSITDVFEVHRPRLHAVAYRLTGDPHDCDDVLQAAWIKASDSPSDGIRSIPAWLTTVVTHEALDVLRRRRRRAEVPIDTAAEARAVDDPEAETLLVDEVGRALLVVLDRLTPTQRVAYVLHDMFAIPFDEVATILGTTMSAAKKSASRARRRVASAEPDQRLRADIETVDAYLAASRTGDISRLLAVLAPDVVRRADAGLVPAGQTDVHGARTVAEQSRLFAERARVSTVALVDGVPSVLVAPHGRLSAAILFSVDDGRITAISVVSAQSLAGHSIRLIDGR